MPRSGYVDDLDQTSLAMWRGRVASAIRGKRGQSLLRDLRDALDNMPEKRLIANVLVAENGDVCALGCIGQRRGIVDLAEIEPDDHNCLGSELNIAECLVKEIEFVNDEGGPWRGETPEQRWTRVRAWVEKNIVQSQP